jgi:folate-binding protein YgfZ
VLRANVRGDDVVAVSSGEAGVPGIELFVPAASAAALRDALADAGATPAGDETLDLLRLEAGRPRWGAELDAERIPLEAGLLERGISTSKGCYTGQEVIIRILHRGHVNWQLRGLLLGGAEPPGRGTELSVEAGGKAVARVTSAARSPAFGQTIALGYVRREVEPGSTLRLPDGGAATVVALPFTTEEAK